MDNNKVNENENKNDKEDFNLYANPYADIDFKKNEIISFFFHILRPPH